MPKVSFKLNEAGRIFDPDEIVLSKSQVEKFMASIRKNAKDNTLKMGCGMIEASLRFMPEETVKYVFREIFSKMNDLMILNALSHASKNGESWSETLGKMMQDEIDGQKE